MQLPSPLEDSSHRATPLLSLSFAYNPSVIIVAMLAFVFLASASIHLFLRFLSRSSSNSSSSSSAAMPPLIHHRRSSSAIDNLPVLSDEEKAVLIESLPLFSLASSIAMLSKSSHDCAVCLSPFHPHDELRLLPACRHAFHSPCIDTWLRSITLPAPPLQSPAVVAMEDPPRSSSFCIEIRSVNRRRTLKEEDVAGVATSLPAPPPPQHQPSYLRSYSLESSFKYVVDEEVEAVVARIRRAKNKMEPAGPSPPKVGPSPPEVEVDFSIFKGSMFT